MESDDFFANCVDPNNRLISGMTFTGGNEGRVLVFFHETFKTGVPTHHLIDPSQTTPVELKSATVDEALFIEKPEYAVDINLALKALKYFYDTQQRLEELEWEEC